MDDLAGQVLGHKRPHPNLMKYYVVVSLVLGPLFPLLLIPRLFRYRSLRYRFDEQGVAMRWGILFHREVSLNYGRIQDIHLQSNLIERWLGLARVQVQTAAGSAKAEMTIEGLPDYEQVRDLLYTRMRGARGVHGRRAAVHGSPPASDLAAVVAVLEETAAELRALREHLAGRRSEDRA